MRRTAGSVTAAARARTVLRALALMGAGGVCVALFAGGDLVLDEGRLVSAVMGSEALATACTGPLVKQLTARGFEPNDVAFGPAPSLGMGWPRTRTFGDSFTFLDGAEAVRVDGIMACSVAGGSATVQFKVRASPHRNA